MKGFLNRTNGEGVLRLSPYCSGPGSILTCGFLMHVVHSLSLSPFSCLTSAVLSNEGNKVQKILLKIKLT